MGNLADDTGPGAFDEIQARAYATAIDIETEFLHDQALLEILCQHARGTGLDLGGGTGRYAAWLLEMGLARSVHVLDNSPPMIEECIRRGLSGLTAQLGDIERSDLGIGKYDVALARFVLMHIRELEKVVDLVSTSMKDRGSFIVVTNVIDGTSTALRMFMEEATGVMKLMLQIKDKLIPVSNYLRTQADYTKAFQQAGLSIEFCKQYEPKILRFEKEPPGVMLSHLVLLGKK